MESCAFSGHRPKNFPWKYNETAQDCILLKEILMKQVEKLIERGVIDFYTGLAQGVDTWAAQAVLALREENPMLRLHCVLPCRDQAVNWETAAQELHQHIQDQADTVTYLSETYREGCMLERNRYMVDHTSILLAVYNGGWRSGTAMTVHYAQKLGREIIRIDPKTGKVTHL